MDQWTNLAMAAALVLASGIRLYAVLFPGRPGRTLPVVRLDATQVFRNPVPPDW